MLATPISVNNRQLNSSAVSFGYSEKDRQAMDELVARTSSGPPTHYRYCRKFLTNHHYAVNKQNMDECNDSVNAALARRFQDGGGPRLSGGGSRLSGGVSHSSGGTFDHYLNVGMNYFSHLSAQGWMAWGLGALSAFLVAKTMFFNGGGGKPKGPGK